MALNSIAVQELYSRTIDEAYAQRSYTQVLDSASISYAKEMGTSKFRVQKVTKNSGGIADYDKETGFKGTGIKTEFEIIDADIDCGTYIVVDALDENDSMGTAFAGGAKIATEGMIKYVDAARIAKISSMAPEKNKISETLTTGEAAIKSLRKAISTSINDRIPVENKLLFINAETKGLIEDMDTFKSKIIMNNFRPENVIIAPSDILYTAIARNGDYDYKKAEGAGEINFMILNKDAVMTKFDKLVSVFTPEQNPTLMAYRMNLRGFGLSGYVFDQKKNAVYVSYKPAA